LGDHYRILLGLACGSEMVACGLYVQPEAQTTTRVFLAVSAGALEIAIVIQGTFEVV